MSLEELKDIWCDLEDPRRADVQLDHQIDKALRSRYQKSIRKFFLFDLLLLGFYVYTIFLTVFRFDELDIHYLKIMGMASITILVILSCIRVLKIINSFKIGYSNYTHVKAIQSLANEMANRQRLYLVHIILGFLLAIALAVIYVKIYNEYDAVQTKLFWMLLIPISLLFIIFLNNWIRKHYTHALSQSEELLQELN